MNNSDSNWRYLFGGIIGLAAVFFVTGVWWGWPTSYDQHDVTRKAIRMLWNRTLDPGVRYWGAFGYQEALFFSVLPMALLKRVLALSPETTVAVSHLLTRVLWALQGVGIVALSYVTSRALFRNHRAALISALFVTLAPGLVAWAHIPQTDISHAFWFTVAGAFTALGWSRERLRYLWLAAIAAGLAAGVKYVGGVVVLAPATAAFLLLPLKRAFGLAIGLMAAAVAIFFVTTPLATGDPANWLVGYLADLLANEHREVTAPLALWTMPGSLWDMFGPGVSVLLVLALGLVFFRAPKQTGRQPWILLAAMVAPYYAALSWQHVSTVRYVLPLATAIAVAGGAVLAEAMNSARLKQPIALGLVVASVIQVTLVGALLTGFVTETRVRLISWLEDHTDEQVVVETLLDHRPFFAGNPPFRVLTRPHWQAETAEMMARVQEDKSSPVRRFYDKLLAGSGMSEEDVLTWVHKERRWLEDRAQEFDQSSQGPSARGSDFVVMNRNTARHYVLDWPGVDPAAPDERGFYESLLQETGPFRLRVRFEPLVPSWLRYPRELWFNVSPPINVYEVNRNEKISGLTGE